MTFEDAYAAAQPFTLCSREKCEVLWREAQAAPPGDFVEVGVYKGGSAMILHAAAPERRLALFDTFTGHPPVQGPFDSPHHGVGRFADTSRREVLARFRDAAEVADWPGDVRYTLPLFRAPIALVHLDADLYESTRAAFEYLVPQLVEGGVLIVDDYSDDDCPGVVVACRALFAQHPDPIEAKQDRATGQLIIRRI